ncbi:MAG: DUF411 domain-containing protein [Mariprofundaceae bacterium]
MNSITKKYAIPFIAALAFIGFSAVNIANATEAIVYKSPGCLCCDDWAKHLENSGFKVKTELRDDMDRVKAANGITDKLASCHTAKIDGYVIEGHVPASDVKRLLKDKPADIVGLTAPGMPMKSPGMQAEGLAPKGYDVLAIKKDGSTEVYTRY